MDTERAQAPQRRWTAWIPAGLIACTVFTLSSIPGQRIPVSLAHGLDKLAHGSIYALFGAAVAFGLHRGRGVTSKTVIVLSAMALGALYGATDEVHQLFTPHRSFELLDGLADTVGALLGGLAYVGWVLTKEKRARGS